MKAKKTKRSPKILATVILAILVAAVAILGIRYALIARRNGITSHYNPSSKTGNQNEAQSGGITDNVTPQPSVVATPQATTAPVTSGAIAVTSPTTGSKIANGTAVRGSDIGHTQVSYRIVDTTAGGVLTTGMLNVSSTGQFSGTIENIAPQPNTHGYIEFFNTNPKTLAESSNVKVSVTF